ncbi:MAG: LIC_12708 family protein [Spirochaetaceae bacterium]
MGQATLTERFTAATIQSHMVTHRALPLLGLTLLLSLLLFSCEADQPVVLEKEELFRIELGKMEDQIDIFEVGGVAQPKKNVVDMVDGSIFVANGNANKVMEFTSFGDLISLIYDPEENPVPVVLQRRSESGERVSTRSATEYSFNQLGEIAVTSDKRIMVEELISDERSLVDEELGVRLNRIVLRFDSNGELIDYLGQEGIGGTPFPYIDRLFVSEGDDLIVITRTMERWTVFGYSDRGELLYRIDISLNRLPVPDGESVIPILENIVPDPSGERLFLKLDYYRERVDEQTGASYGIQRDQSRVYWLDLASGRYEDYVVIPSESGGIFRQEGREEPTAGALYELVGVARGGHLFLLRRENRAERRLLILTTEGQAVRRRTLEMEEAQQVFRSTRVSPQGIITSLVGREDSAEVLWWRADRLIGNRNGDRE